MNHVYLENPSESLAAAIITQACSDYRRELKRIKENPRNKDAISNMNALERFFESAWYGALTTVDGRFIIRKMREENES